MNKIRVPRRIFIHVRELLAKFLRGFILNSMDLFIRKFNNSLNPQKTNFEKNSGQSNISNLIYEPQNDNSSIEEEISSELIKKQDLNFSFQRRSIHGYAKKKIAQPKQHRSYVMSNRIPREKKKKEINTERYNYLFTYGCCSPVENSCLQNMKPGVVLQLFNYWNQFNREEKRKKLLELLLPQERKEKTSTTKVMNGRYFELKLLLNNQCYPVCPISFYFLTSTGHELIASLFDAPEKV